MLDVAGASTVARAERYVVVIKLTILLLFVVGMLGVSATRIGPDQRSPPLSLVAGGMIVFLAYEGVELIANAAEDVDDPGRTLTRAYDISVLFVLVLYVLVAVVAVGSVPVAQLVGAKDDALAVAARPALCPAGFVLIGVAAMLSTASAINATLDGSARMTYTIAKARELPAQLERPIWNQPLEGLILTAVATLVLANVMDLASISPMGSAGFLLIFATVNAAEARTSKERGSEALLDLDPRRDSLHRGARGTAHEEQRRLGDSAVRHGGGVVHDRSDVSSTHRSSTRHATSVMRSPSNAHTSAYAHTTPAQPSPAQPSPNGVIKAP